MTTADNQRTLKVLKPITPNSSKDEVVDSIADVFEVGRAVDEALKDGFQPWSDILQLASQEPKVREVINDLDVFIEQFLELKPETALEAVLEIRDRLVKDKPMGKVTKSILGVLFLLSKAYGTIERSISDFHFQRDGWKALAAGNLVLPPSK